MGKKSPGRRKKLVDITQLKRAEVDLKRLATVVIDSNDAVMVLDLEGRILDWNRASQEIYGYSEAEARQLNVDTLVPEDQRAHFRDLLAAVKRGETVEPLEVKRRTKDGRTLDIWIKITKLVDDHGLPIGVVTTGRDITARKRADEELREAQKWLRADLDATKRLLKIGSLFLMEGHIEPVFAEIVDAAIEISGADFGNLQLLDRESGDLMIVAHKGFPPYWLDFWNQTSKGHGSCGTALERRGRVIIENVETSQIFVGTPAIEVQLRAGVRAVQSTPLIGRTGDTLGILSTHYRRPGKPDDRVLRQLDLLARSVTDILETQTVRQLESANQQLRDNDQQKTQFISVLSHELRNPLGVISLSINILEHTPSSEKKVREAQLVISRQVAYMTRLIEDLLDVARITTGKIQLQRQILDFNGLAQRTVEDHREMFLKSGVVLEMLAAPSEVWVNGDRTRLAQVIGNLLQNAAKFTPSGGKTTVSVGTSPTGGQAIVRVQDTGKGIVAEFLPRLFDPFSQADTTLDRSKGGLGLGLAVVKGIVEMHGGSIRAESGGVGKGTVFTIVLPIETACRPTSPSVSRGDAVGIPCRVLVIDDNTEAADSLGEMLKLNGNEVEVAYSGPRGLEKARAFGPDVVLCDIGLPGMDGYQVAKMMRAEPELGRILLIAVSGYADPDAIEKSREAGFDSHFAKPINIEKLERALKEFHAREKRPTGLVQSEGQPVIH
jgi:PAS domain S-box-containing protein